MKRVVVRLMGGLGNQLFGYAAARRLALKNDAELVLDTVSGFKRDFRYRRTFALQEFNLAGRVATPWERLEPFERLRRGLWRARERRLPFAQRNYLEQEGADFDARLLRHQVRRDTYIEGVWTSEDYFKDVQDTIRADLAIRPPTDRLNQEMSTRIAALKAPISVHVRFFSLPGYANADQHVAADYYRRAAAYLDERIEDGTFVVFSDRPQEAMAALGLPEQRTLLVDHNTEHTAHADMWLMQQCQHFITANSTFSWWGAWLGERPGKQVVVPSVQTIPHPNWNIKGLIPDRWVQL